MREAHPIERIVGMEYYVSDADGVGGHLRASPEDFRVTELESFDTAPVDADTVVDVGSVDLTVPDTLGELAIELTTTAAGRMVATNRYTTAVVMPTI